MLRSYILGLVASVFIASVSAECTADDVAVWSAPDFVRKVVQFARREDIATNLALITLGKKKKATASILEKAKLTLSLSTECAQCFADNIICASKHCALPCMANPEGLDCKQCNETHCSGPFKTCVGEEAAANLPVEPSTESTAEAVEKVESESA